MKEISLNKNGIISLTVFVITITVSSLTIVTAIFPSFLLRYFGGRAFSNEINPFELGVNGPIIIITNAIFFALLLLHWKKRLPSLIEKPLNSFFNFDLSRNLALLIMIILVGLYITFSVGELFDGKFQPDYNVRVKGWLDNYTFFDIGYWGLSAHLQAGLGVLSVMIFDNPQVMPFFSDITLIVLVYFLTLEISGKRLSGIIASAIVAQSTVFLVYDVGITYPSFWVTFYLGSLLFIKKFWPVSSLTWALGIFTKILVGAYLPMTLFFILRSNISKKRKIYLYLSYAGIIVLGLGILFSLGETIPINLDKEFEMHDFLGGFTSTTYSLRYDVLVLVLVVPVTVGLYLRSRRGNLQADSVNFLIFGTILSGALVPAAGLAINVPYRFLPLIVFVAIALGVTISSKIKT